MCRKFVLVSNLEKMESRYHVALSSYTPVLAASYCISAGETSYVITSENPQELQACRFGLTPWWAKRPMELINARAEGDKNPTNDPHYTGPSQIFLKRAFMKPLQSQRCLVPADAYYEWSAAKKPYLVYLQDKVRPFAMAGLYDTWQNPETKEIVRSFAIITTTANPMLQQLGVKRMPVILRPGYERDWIKADRSLSQVLQLLRQLDSQKMNAYPVSELVDTPCMNDAAMISPMGERVQMEVQPLSKIKSNHGTFHKKKGTGAWNWGGGKTEK